MKQLKKDLQTVLKDLKALNQKTQKMMKQVEKLEKAQTTRKVKTKPVAVKKPAAKKPVTKKSAPSESVLKIINRRKKGADVATLAKLTGFKESNLRAIIFRLRKKDKIKSTTKGNYIKA